MRYGRLYVFAAGDTWEPELLYNLTNCEGRGQRGSHRRHPVGNRPLTPPLASPVCHRQSRRQASRSRRRRPATWALRWWAGLCSTGGPTNRRRWLAARHRCLCPRGAFSHVVAYNRQTSALRGTADTLLDAASYGSRWVLLSPAPAAGVARALRPRAPRP